jgi:hypothetical protein
MRSSTERQPGWRCVSVTSKPRGRTRTLQLGVWHNGEAFGARSSILISYGSGGDGDGFQSRQRGDSGGALEAKSAAGDPRDGVG